MGNIKKKAVPLSVFYLRYLVYMLTGIVAVIASALAVFILFEANGIIYPANYAQEQAKEAKEKIDSTGKFSNKLVPPLCKYALFDQYGNVKEANINGRALTDAWEAVNGKKALYSLIGNQYYYTTARCSEGYCVIAYRLIPQYKLPLLRKYLIPPQNLILICSLCLILFIIVITSVCFGRKLNKKLSPLIHIAEKIQNQELGFTITKGSIKEINTVLDSIDNMRAALKESLESQWNMEHARKEQIMALAHDLKTPLTLVRGNAELLYDTKLTKEQEELACYITKSSIQMQDYVGQLINITKNGYKTDMQKTSISLFVNEVIKQAESLCAIKNIYFQKQESYSASYFMADKELLMRAFINIFANAMENTPKGGTIYLDISSQDNYIVFKTTDTGKGFSEEALKHATEQFYMEDKSRSSKQHSGIGLYMADLIIKQHKGKLLPTNSDRTKGAEVIVKIPVLIQSIY